MTAIRGNWGKTWTGNKRKRRRNVVCVWRRGFKEGKEGGRKFVYKKNLPTSTRLLSFLLSLFPISLFFTLLFTFFSAYFFSFCLFLCLFISLRYLPPYLSFHSCPLLPTIAHWSWTDLPLRFVASTKFFAQPTSVMRYPFTYTTDILYNS